MNASHKSAVNARIALIEHLQGMLTSVWSGSVETDSEGTYYVRLGEAIENAEAMLETMKKTLEALQQLEPGRHK